jgi:lipoprotein-releasing system ATP-binding protein
MIIATGISHTYPGPEEVEVLRSLDLEVAAGESVAIMGPSGSGKSTLLAILGALDVPTAGVVEVGGQSLAGLSAEALAKVRAEQVGFVFQDHFLLPQCTLWENVLLPTLGQSGGSGDAQARAKELLAKVELEDRLHHFPSELSAGQRQRAAIVRALINKPSLLLADEPTGALDRRQGERLADLLISVQEAEGVAMVVATHSEDLARRMGRTVALVDGRLLAAEEGA